MATDLPTMHPKEQRTMTPDPQGNPSSFASLDHLMQQVQDITWGSLSKLHQATLYPNTCPDGNKALNELLLKPAKLKDLIAVVMALAATLPKPNTEQNTLAEALSAVDAMNDDELIEALLRVLDPMLDAGLTLMTDIRDTWPVSQTTTLPTPLSYHPTQDDDA